MSSYTAKLLFCVNRN